MGCRALGARAGRAVSVALFQMAVNLGSFLGGSRRRGVPRHGDARSRTRSPATPFSISDGSVGSSVPPRVKLEMSGDGGSRGLRDGGKAYWNHHVSTNFQTAIKHSSNTF